MYLLTSIFLVPVLAGLACLLLRSHRAMETANALGFGLVLALGIQLVHQVIVRGVVTDCGESFRADALSAWMVLLISVVSLGSSLYAGHYFQRDLAAGVVTAGQ